MVFWRQESFFRDRPAHRKALISTQALPIQGRAHAPNHAGQGHLWTLPAVSRRGRTTPAEKHCSVPFAMKGPSFLSFLSGLLLTTLTSDSAAAPPRSLPGSLRLMEGSFPAHTAVPAPVTQRWTDPRMCHHPICKVGSSESPRGHRSTGRGSLGKHNRVACRDPPSSCSSI